MIRDCRQGFKTLWQDRGEQALKDRKAKFNSANATAYCKAG